MPLTQAALQLIKNEITNDPSARGYAGKTADAITDLINEPLSQGTPIYDDLEIDVQKVALELIKRGKWEAVVNAANTVIASGHVSAYGLVEACKLVNVSDKVNVGAIRTAIINLISAGVLNAADGQALQDLARKELKKSRSEIIVGQFIGKEEVEVAQALP